MHSHAPADLHVMLAATPPSKAPRRGGGAAETQFKAATADDGTPPPTHTAVTWLLQPSPMGSSRLLTTSDTPSPAATLPPTQPVLAAGDSASCSGGLTTASGAHAVQRHYPPPPQQQPFASDRGMLSSLLGSFPDVGPGAMAVSAAIAPAAARAAAVRDGPPSRTTPLPRTPESYASFPPPSTAFTTFVTCTEGARSSPAGLPSGSLPAGGAGVSGVDMGTPGGTTSQLETSAGVQNEPCVQAESTLTAAAADVHAPSTAQQLQPAAPRRSLAPSWLQGAWNACCGSFPPRTMSPG